MLDFVFFRTEAAQVRGISSSLDRVDSVSSGKQEVNKICAFGFQLLGSLAVIFALQMKRLSAVGEFPSGPAHLQS